MAFSLTAGQKVRPSNIRTSLPLGVIARGRRTTSSTGTTTTSQTSAQGVIRISAAVLAGRLYRVACGNFGTFASAAGRTGVQLTYTTDGSTPAASSPVLHFTQQENPSAGVVDDTSLEGLYVPGADLTLRVLLSLWRVAGSGTHQTYGASNWPLHLFVEDIGLDPGDTGTVL